MRFALSFPTAVFISAEIRGNRGLENNALYGICNLRHAAAVAWTVEIGDEFEPEFNQLHEDVRMEILALARRGQQFGPQLGRPRVDTLNGSRHPNMKECASVRLMVNGG